MNQGLVKHMYPKYGTTLPVSALICPTKIVGMHKLMHQAPPKDLYPPGNEHIPAQEKENHHRLKSAVPKRMGICHVSFQEGTSSQFFMHDTSIRISDSGEPKLGPFREVGELNTTQGTSRHRNDQCEALSRQKLEILCSWELLQHDMNAFN